MGYRIEGSLHSLILLDLAVLDIFTLGENALLVREPLRTKVEITELKNGSHLEIESVTHH
jgi:hypothetical protein